jgi:hypothetical protein
MNPQNQYFKSQMSEGNNINQISQKNLQISKVTPFVPRINHQSNNLQN